MILSKILEGVKSSAFKHEKITIEDGKIIQFDSVERTFLNRIICTCENSIGSVDLIGFSITIKTNLGKKTLTNFDIKYSQQTSNGIIYQIEFNEIFEFLGYVEFEIKTPALNYFTACCEVITFNI